MTGLDGILSNPAALPGWFGKLPGMGDFAHRRLPEAFRARWDQWLQHGMMQLRLRHEDWTARYLEGPVWFFALAQDVAGPACWVGVVMPSVDGVGRYFPFAVACELRRPWQSLPAAAWPALHRWWQRAAQAALEGLDQDQDAARFDDTLARLFADAEDAVGPDAPGPAPAWPAGGQSLWLTHPGGEGQRLLSAGLPREERFDLLFACAQAPARPADAEPVDKVDPT